ncbi:MAG: hypothetical protein DMG55_31820 [Acidobacteria bacterium]|nr:MAG: hypothetical protein DMG55_31820 [Acidobacteriota bacterium]
MSSPSAERAPPIQSEDVQAMICKSMAQSTSAFNRGDVETILVSYAADAVVLPPRSPAVQGLPAIRQLFESLLAAGYGNAAVELDRIEYWGNVALAIGRYTLQLSIKSASSDVDRGKYVGHWRRMPDGQFRVTLSMWNSDRWHRPSDP